MKTSAQILGTNLADALKEACCDNCGTMSKKLGKKVCCGGKKPKARLEVKTEECHFIYTFPSEDRAKGFIEAARTRYGWKFERDGSVAGLITKDAADRIASEFGGEDALRSGTTDARSEQLSVTPFLKRCFDASDKRSDEQKTEATDRHTHPFIKRCVAAMTAKEGGSKDPHSPKQLSSAFAVCTASKKAHPAAAKEKAKEGVPAKRMAAYEKALSTARKARKTAGK